MATFIETLEIPVREGTEVLVVGGGVAGVAAALAARREGAAVVLMEKTALLGGLATNGLINWYEPLCDGKGEKMACGIAEELLRLAIRYGDDTLPEIWRQPEASVDAAKLRSEKHHPVGGRCATFYSPTILQLAMDELLEREGVTLKLDILAAAAHMENGQCTGVICESKSGREFFPAKVVVDATGDADILWRAGLPCVEGKNYLSMVAHVSDISEKEKALGLRRWRAFGADLHGVGHPEGYPLYAGVSNEEVTRFLLDGRRMLFNRLRKDQDSGRADRHSLDVTALPTMAQFRTTRRLCGAQTLTEGDQGVRHENSIGLCPDFERVGDWYEIPWGCLHRDGNLLAAGRMISASGWAWDVTRVIPVAALTGQAAGTAAALMSRREQAANEVTVSELQQRLAAGGVRLHR